MLLTSFSRGLYNLINSAINKTFAITFQNFIELNVKRGQQWETSQLFRDIPAGGEKVFLFRTGDLNVIVKNRVIRTNAEDVSYLLSTNPTISSTGDPDGIYNLNEEYQEELQSEIYLDPTVSSQGDLRLVDWIPGSAQIGGRSQGGFATDGIERVLSPNSDYLLVIRNDGDGPVDVSYYLTFYEGVVNPLGPEELPL